MKRIKKNFKKTYSHPACDGHTPAPQKFMSLEVMVRVCSECGRQYEPATGITYQR